MNAHPNLNAFFHDLDTRENRRNLEIALPKHVDVESFARIVMQAVASEPKLYDADRGSLMRACLEAAQDGLLPDGREGAIVPFRHRNSNRYVAQWQPMVWGLVKLVRQSEQLVDIAAHIVRQADHFDYWVDEKGEHFTHRPDYAQTDSAPVLVYAFARLVNGGFYFEAMHWTEIDRFRELSRAKADDTPWSKWTDEMAKVRPLKRLCKRLPMTTKARDAFARDDARDAVLFDTTPDDPLQAINRTIREGRVETTAGPRRTTSQAPSSPAALTNEPSPTIEWDLPSHPLEHVTPVPAADDRIATQTRRVREAPEAAPEPTLDFVLERIERSRNVDELAEVAPYAAMLRKDGDKETARRAYGDKLNGLRASAAPERGEEPVQEASPLRTYAEVRHHIERAPSLEALDEAMSMIDAVSHPDHREELRDMAQARRESFTQ